MFFLFELYYCDGSGDDSVALESAWASSPRASSSFQSFGAKETLSCAFRVTFQ